MTDDLNERAADMVLETEQEYQEKKAEQEAFLDTVSEHEGTPPIETECNLIGEYTVPLKAKLNGELIDRMSAVQAQGKRIEENPREEGHKVSEVADRACQILADVIDDPDWHKDKFYAAYQSEGFDPLLTMLDRAFESLKNERERMEGRADGFRPKPEGT